jgi:hypothetical protein
MWHVKRCFLKSPNPILLLSYFRDYNFCRTFLTSRITLRAERGEAERGTKLCSSKLYWFGLILGTVAYSCFVTTKGNQIDNSGLNNQLKQPF